MKHSVFIYLKWIFRTHRRRSSLHEQWHQGEYASCQNSHKISNNALRLAAQRAFWSLRFSFRSIAFKIGFGKRSLILDTQRNLQSSPNAESHVRVLHTISLNSYYYTIVYRDIVIRYVFMEILNKNWVASKDLWKLNFGQNMPFKPVFKSTVVAVLSYLP